MGRKLKRSKKKKAGNPEKDMLFELFRQHLIEDDGMLKKREKDYRVGKILDFENKEFATKLLISFMKDFRKKYLRAGHRSDNHFPSFH